MKEGSRSVSAATACDPVRRRKYLTRVLSPQCVHRLPAGACFSRQTSVMVDTLGKYRLYADLASNMWTSYTNNIIWSLFLTSTAMHAVLLIASPLCAPLRSAFT
jgi:hypothetical protein